MDAAIEPVEEMRERCTSPETVLSGALVAAALLISGMIKGGWIGVISAVICFVLIVIQSILASASEAAVK